jgi:hypothetical protein
VLSNWGLIAPEALRVAPNWSQPGGAPLPALAPPPAAGPAPAAEAAAPSPPAASGPAAPAPGVSEARLAVPPAPVKGSIAPGPEVAAPPQKSKGGPSQRDQKAKEEELRRLRREVAAKLKFQNSLDTSPPKSARQTPKQKLKEKGMAKAPAPKTQPSQMLIARYRDGKAARARMAEMQKRGEKVTLKQGKDEKGAYYALYRQVPPANPKSLAQGKKEGETTRKPHGQPGQN